MIVLLLACLCAFVGVTVGVVVVATATAERRAARERLRALDELRMNDVRQRSLAAPLARRVAAPAARLANFATRHVWPPQQVAATRTKLQLAGIVDRDSTPRFLAVRLLGILLAPLSFVVAFRVLHFQGTEGLAVGALLATMAVAGPPSWLSRKMKERQLTIARSLPDILDVLTISVEAGLGFEQALARVVQAIPGPLSDEFGRMLGETRAGAGRADALRALDERTNVPDVRSFILALIQADTFGISIGRVLRAQADEMRIKRRQAAQEKAQKAPIKMLVPMVFCVFPSLFVVVIGPAVITLMKGLK